MNILLEYNFMYAFKNNNFLCYRPLCIKLIDSNLDKCKTYLCHNLQIVATYPVLKFGGGCQGCSSVDLTLKHGVEKTLIDQIEGLAGVRDITDHEDTSNAYM